MIGGQEVREHCEVAGLHVASWVSLFFTCHSFVMGSPVRTEWPDGRTTLKQDAVVVSMFNVISEELAKHQKAEAEAQSKNDPR